MTQTTNQSTLTITDAARAHIRRQLDQTESAFIRLGVKESGCNGYMYTLEFLERPHSDDVCYDFADDVNVCVASNDKDMVLGTEIDLITQGLNSALVFKNSKATSYCGCGESFAVGDEDNSNGDTLDPDNLATEVGSG